MDIFGKLEKVASGPKLLLTALAGIYLLLVTMQQVLRYKYGWHTLGNEKIQKKSLVNIFNFLKNNNFISMSGRFFVFSIKFVIGPISYQKKPISKF